MIMTKHAKLRWSQRFGKFGAKEVFANSRTPTKNVLKDIRKQCPASCSRTKISTGGYYKLHKRIGAVFVVNLDSDSGEEIVITVFPYNKGERTVRYS